MRRGRLLLLVAALGLTSACRTSSKRGEAESGVASAPKAAGESATAPEQIETEPTPVVAPVPAGNVGCGERPAAEACCEALIPSCNECRARNKKAQADWAARCDKKGPAAARQPEPGCDRPPVAACCNDNTDECRDCRAAAISQLLEWKDRCAPKAAHACDQAPPQTACCQALTPSCDACRSRNKRVMGEWRERCGK